MKKIIAIPIIAIIGIIGWYLGSPLFVNATVDEELPVIMQTSEIKTLYAGNFMGVGDGVHDAKGDAKVLTQSDGQLNQRILRLENFQASNGPDLHVFLSKDPNGIDGGYINLGRLKGNIGNQNYEIPADVYLSEYDNVLIWCKMFSVLFGHAELTSA